MFRRGQVGAAIFTVPCREGRTRTQGSRTLGIAAPAMLDGVLARHGGDAAAARTPRLEGDQQRALRVATAPLSPHRRARLRRPRTRLAPPKHDHHSRQNVCTNGGGRRRSALRNASTSAAPTRMSRRRRRRPRTTAAASSAASAAAASSSTTTVTVPAGASTLRRRASAAAGRCTAAACSSNPTAR